MKFFMPCVPPKSTHQASLRIITPKDGRKPFVGKYESSKGKLAQNFLATLLMPHAPAEAFEGPVTVSVYWTYPWRVADTKKRRAAGWQPCYTKPDCDNLCKTLFDCMTRLGFWEDDSRVASLRFTKGWGDRPGIHIEIKKWSGLGNYGRACVGAEEFLAGQGGK